MQKMSDPDRAGSGIDDELRALIDQALNKAAFQQDALIEILHVAQQANGFLSDDILDYVSRQLELPPAMVYGVATFYNFFTLRPRGRHTCVVCLGTACYIKGADVLKARLEQEFGIKSGETTADGLLSLETARCLGSCSLAPMLTFDDRDHGPLTPEEALQLNRRLATERKGD